jgi:hypothetical protein
MFLFSMFNGQAAKEEAEDMFTFVYKTVDNSCEAIKSDHFPIGGLNKDIKTTF